MRLTRFLLGVIAASFIPDAVQAKDARTFAVLHFYGNGPLVTARMDPIVNPGEVSGHVHAVMGGNAFALDMPGTTAKNATCTNALIINDKSNYWTPSVYFHASNGSFIPVPMFYMNVYYFFDATDDEIVAFPDGFRMVSGNAMLRSPPESGTGDLNLDPNEGPIQPVQFTCPRKDSSVPLYTDGAYGVADSQNLNAGSGFPDRNCDGYASPLRADIHFPSCYNPAAGPENYKNNTAFPTSKGASAAGRANCPDGWIHVPHLFFEVYWNTPLFADYWTPGEGKQPFVLADGDPTGYSIHGDFLNGWDTETLQTIVDTCDAGTSGMDKCPTIIGGVNPTSNTCNIDAPFTEQVDGVLSALPGCNPLQYGPANATMVTDCSNPTVSATTPTVTAKPTSTATTVPASVTPSSVTTSATQKSTSKTPTSSHTGTTSSASTTKPNTITATSTSTSITLKSTSTSSTATSATSSTRKSGCTPRNARDN